MEHLYWGTPFIIATIVIASALKMANTWEKVVILRAGKLRGVKGPGLFAIIPVIDSAMAVIYETTKERGATILIPTSMVDSLNPVVALALAGQDVAPLSKLCSGQLVGPLAAARIDLRGGGVDRVAMVIEHTQRSGFVVHEIGLQVLEGLINHEKRGLHGRIVAPESYCPPRRIVAAAVVWKIQWHSPSAIAHARQPLPVLATGSSAFRTAHATALIQGAQHGGTGLRHCRVCRAAAGRGGPAALLDKGTLLVRRHFLSSTRAAGAPAECWNLSTQIGGSTATTAASDCLPRA